MLGRRAILLGLALALASALSGCAFAPPPSAPSPLLDKPLPDLRRRALSGAEVDAGKAQGKVVVVKFFAKYCEPCIRTLPELEALHREHPEVLVVGVAEDESEDDVREVVATHRLTFEVVHDRGQVISGRFRVRELPRTFVADVGGTLRWVGGSATTKDGLAAVIQAAKQPAPHE